ncbi:MAG TPA: DUF6176 family protein [Candidatus Dormibacteraeota bacterium]|jgi:hypothetical protein|nr:DUF6176 family protein [Candidatus Dormibacteraeota bacterium]
MSSWAIVVPILPGKEAALKAFTEQLAARLDEYVASRRSKGMTMERVYSMETPQGTMVTAYFEAEGDMDFPALNQKLTASDKDIDKFFVNGLHDIHGIDFSQPMPGPGPEKALEWGTPGAVRGRGLAFSVPLLPGKSGAVRAFFAEAVGPRRAEHDQSRREKGLTLERAFLNVTPMGDVICVYLEGDDPARANAEWAVSTTAYDTWFREKGRELSGIDFSQPMPAISEVWDWHTAAATV